jgi:YHS domain-containing protein
MKKTALAFLLVACNSTPKAAPPAPVAAAPVAATAAVAEEPPIPLGTKMKCTVSGEDFTVGAKTVQIVYQGKRYAFCCADCLPEFNKNPAKFARN